MARLSVRNINNTTKTKIKKEVERLRIRTVPSHEELEMILLLEYLLSGYIAYKREEDKYPLTNKVIRKAAKRYPSLVI